MFVAVILTAGTLGLCLLDSLDNKRYALTEKYNKAYVKALDIINGFPLKDRFRVKLLNFNLWIFNIFLSRYFPIIIAGFCFCFIIRLWVVSLEYKLAVYPPELVSKIATTTLLYQTVYLFLFAILTGLGYQKWIYELSKKYKTEEENRNALHLLIKSVGYKEVTDLVGNPGSLMWHLLRKRGVETAGGLTLVGGAYFGGTYIDNQLEHDKTRRQHEINNDAMVQKMRSVEQIQGKKLSEDQIKSYSAEYSIQTDPAIQSRTITQSISHLILGFKPHPQPHQFHQPTLHNPHFSNAQQPSTFKTEIGIVNPVTGQPIGQLDVSKFKNTHDPVAKQPK